MKRINNRQKGWILLLASLFVVFTTGTLVVIGGFSSYLITNIRRRIVLTILILATILLVFSIYMLVKFRKRKMFKRWVRILCDALIGLYAVGCTTFLFLLYGPIPNFREWLITTAMATMNHQYYCKWFYSDETIEDVLNSNYILESGEETDTSLVDKKVEKTYKNEYERDILEHDEDDLYKIIRFKVNGQEAYLAAVYDPSKVTVGVSQFIMQKGQYVSTMAKYYKAPLAINGGGFNDPGHNSTGGVPIGVTISHSKVITNSSTAGSSYGIIGFTNEDVLVLKKNIDAHTLVKSGVRDAVTMGPFLIVNGKASAFKGNGGWGVAARTAIGQRKDGIVLFLVVDSNPSRTKGATMVDLIEIMQRYGAINAANLDGGTSSVMSIDGEILNDPIDSTGAHKTRGVPTIFMVK